MSFALLRLIARQISTALTPLLQKISWSAACTAQRADPSSSSRTVMNTSSKSSDCWSVRLVMSWFDPSLSLEKQANLAIDQRRAAALRHDDLLELVRRLIADSYQQQQIIDCAVRRITALEIEQLLAEELASGAPGIKPPTAAHEAMAADLLAKG
jgi:hypothetical protein